MTQPESALSLRIQKALKGRGAYVWKVHGNEYTPNGTPDIVGVYRGRFIAFETKMPGGKLSAIQEYRIARLRLSGALVVAPCYTIPQALELLDKLDGLMDLDHTQGEGGGPVPARVKRMKQRWSEIQQLYGQEAREILVP